MPRVFVGLLGGCSTSIFTSNSPYKNARYTRMYMYVYIYTYTCIHASPVVHVCRDPRLPVLFSGLLSEPCLAAVLVINGLEHRSPRTREKIGRFIYSDLVLEPWWTAPGPLTALPL